MTRFEKSLFRFLGTIAAMSILSTFLKDYPSVILLIIALPILVLLRKEVKRGLYKLFTGRDLRLRDATMAIIDHMDGRRFEEIVGEILESGGYDVDPAGGPGDLGVDLIATDPKGARFAVQCKRQAAMVGRRAVSDAVAGRAVHACTGAMVVTNSLFTRGAVELANVTGCILIDRSALREMIPKELEASEVA